MFLDHRLLVQAGKNGDLQVGLRLGSFSIQTFSRLWLHWKRQDCSLVIIRIPHSHPKSTISISSISLRLLHYFTAATEEKTMLQAGTFIRGQFETSHMLALHSASLTASLWLRVLSVRAIRTSVVRGS
jgi:hypothetical protein